ncbi:MAG TPA: ParB/RepB/Spo0J family partition protein [Terriglobales bacterium]|nr:ParB/RepB/Spo0J family partition protein [Terriglobales bacterium]
MTTAGNVARDTARDTAEPANRDPANKDKEKVEKRRALGRGLESLLPGPRAVELRSTGQPGAAVPTQAHQAAGEKQVPHRAFSPVRNDKEMEAGEGVIPVIRAEAEEPENVGGMDRGAAEPRSAEQPRAAVPTYSSSAAGVPADAEEEESITILAMAESRTPSNLVINLGIEQIDKNPYQTREVEDDDALEELSESIKANGVVQPIVVRPAEEDGRFILILGERRLMASKKAGKDRIPALVRRVSDQQAAEMTIVENLQREDLSPLEQAQAFKVLSQEFHLTQQEIGARVGLARQSVANYMRLLKLPRVVMQMLAEKRLSFEKAKALLTLEDDDRIQHAALFAVKKGMNIEEIERLVLSMDGDLAPFPGMPTTEKKPSGARWVDPNVRAAQGDLERLLGVRVRIRDRKGKGKIVIEYSTVNDYERVVSMLRGKSSG